LTVARKLVLAVLLVALLGGAGWGIWRWHSSDGDGPSFRTERAVRGNLVALINASGTLVPEEVIDVGAQVAGQIVSFGPDLDDSRKVIDYRSRVEEGTILAKIDDALYAPEVDIARADLAVNEAEVARAEADVVALKAKLRQAERDYERGRKLPSTTISGAELDALRSAAESAAAALPAGEATVLKAKKNVERARKVLLKAEKNLAYCTIRSPVKGVIVDRRVNIGQTVVSSLTAPSLFLIAKDLKRMKVWATVNEADIGRIHNGQTAYFKVDAYPNDTFVGQVEQIRLNATMTQNVVTYTVVVDTDNRSGKLLPYLTANLQFRVDQRQNSLLVPNSALRYRPAPSRVAPEYQEAYARARRRRPVTNVMKPGSRDPRESRGTVWVEENGFVRPIKVQIGLTDGISTEVVKVLDGELSDGTELVTGEQQNKAGSGGNPFTPKLFGNKKQD
jgi:HlyD family secretion protein